MTLKTKRILLIAIPAAVLIAAALLLWLFLGRGSEAEQPFEIRRDQQSNQIVYCALKGMVDEQEAAVMEFPCYSFHPPESWTQTQDAMEDYVDVSPRLVVSFTANWYEDVYQSPDGTEWKFGQRPAGFLILTTHSDPEQYGVDISPSAIQEVQFGGDQVIYYQRQGEEGVYETGIFWVEERSLLQLAVNDEMDLNEMLGLIGCVDTKTLRQPFSSPPVPLTLQRGSYQEIIQGTTVQVEEHSYRSQGSPEIPQPPSLLEFFPPAGYTVEKQWEDPDGYACERLYLGEEGTRLYFSCVAGEAGFFGSQGYGDFTLPFSGMSREELADPNAVSDAAVKGNPAFVHINDQVSEIGWIDGYCTLQIRSTAPMTEEELIALAETVE